MQDLALVLLRGIAEHGARVGWAPTPAGLLRFAVRGPEGAPQLLLLHGLGDSLAGWARVVPALARAHEVHLLDLPGHGLSGDPPDFRLATLAAAVSCYAQRLSAPMIVGHSLGGWLALEVVLGAQVNPRCLQLVNPAGALLDEAAWAPFRALVSAADGAGAERYLARAFHRAPLALRLFPGEVLKAMQAKATRGILAAVEAADFLTEARLAALRLPVRIVWGESDRLLPQGTLDFFRRALPQAEVLPLAGAGHLPHLETPRALAEALLRPFGRSPRK